MGSISNGGGDVCRSTSRRFAIVPEEAWLEAVVVSAEAVTAGTRQEAGLAVRQPEPDSPAPAGDLSPTLSGRPEVHVEGELAVVKSGVVETARFGWVRDGDDPEADLQLRQSPHVLGRRPDMLRSYGSAGAATTRHILRPKLLPLLNGDLLAIWLEADVEPLYNRRSTVLTSSQGQLYLSRLDKATGTWSAAITGPIPNYPVLTYLTNADLVQFPDTGEILCFFIGNQTMTPGFADPRRLYVFGSTDDGDTWVEKRRLFFDGSPPDVLLDANGDGTADDTTPFQAVAAELLPSGRIVLMAVSEGYTWSLVSDDRGASFAPHLVKDHPADHTYAGHGAASTLARNDVAAFVACYRDVASDPNTQTLWLTANGVDWTETDLNTTAETVDVAVCISPDGWPHLYGSGHSFLETATYRYRDWLWGRRFKTRDPLLGADPEDLFPMGSAVLEPMAFHCHETPGSSGPFSRLGENIDEIRFGGFVGVDAVEWRGQVVLAAVVQRDANAIGTVDDQPTLSETALMVYRANHWQPIQEVLSDARDSAGAGPSVYPMAGRVYNRTWDCYGLPGNWNWTPNGAGSQTIVAGGTQGGYLELKNIRDYNDAGLPAQRTSQSGVVRAVVLPVTGGSMTQDEIAIRVFLNSSTNTATGLVVRFQNVGTAVRVGLFQFVGGANLGVVDLLPACWVEILLVTRNTGTSGKWGATLYARSHPRIVGDPDWDEPYTLVADVDDLVAYAVATDGLAWGQFVDGDQTSYWKTVQLHRTEEDDPVEVNLERRGTDWIDVDSENDKSATGTGEAASDSGIENVMRAAVACSEPPQFLTRGLSASWRGEALTRGEFAHATGYDFAAECLQTVPVSREWRSEDTGDAVELIFDADPDGNGARFRPDGLAVFGRNFPALDLRMNDSASGPWDGTAPFIRVFGYRGSALAEDRYTHVWANRVGPFLVPYWVEGTRLTVFPSAGTSPWRPHQYRSLKTGPRFYLAIRNSNSGETYVYRIRDNTEDTLLLHTAPLAAEAGLVAGDVTTWPYGWVIFSSTFAAMLGPSYPEDFTPSGSSTPYGNSHVRGYRYLRIMLPRVYHRDADEAFYRLGCVMLGKTIDLGSPDASWGWRRGTESGSDLETARDGSRRSSRRHSPRRTISLDATYLRPPTEMHTDTFAAPQDAMPVARRSWAHWMDAVRRLEVDDTPCALVWEGDRAWASADENDLSPTAADPMDVFPARVTDPGTFEHVQWENALVNLPGGQTTLPRPAMRVSGVTFTEEF